jgi:hypothetical protein
VCGRQCRPGPREPPDPCPENHARRPSDRAREQAERELRVAPFFDDDDDVHAPACERSAQRVDLNGSGRGQASVSAGGERGEDVVGSGQRGIRERPSAAARCFHVAACEAEAHPVEGLPHHRGRGAVEGERERVDQHDGL